MNRRLVQLYTGEGRGKTTAAMGLALRAIGQGWKIRVYQFMKSKPSGEFAPFQRLGVNITLCSSQQKAVSDMDGIELEILKRDTQKAWKEFQEVLKQEIYDLIILDEATHIVGHSLVPIEEFVQVVLQKPASVELVLTGRNAHEKLLEVSDIVTEMVKQKHVIDEAKPALVGADR